MQHLYRPPTWHPRPPAGRYLPSKTGVLAGLDLNSSTYEFGQRTGLAVTDFALFTSALIYVSVYADADLALTSQLFAYSETTHATTGQLTRKTHASLVSGSWYFLVFRNGDGSLNGCVRIQAS